MRFASVAEELAADDLAGVGAVLRRPPALA
jgi:hypothetical protein